MNPIKPNYWQHKELQKKIERQELIEDSMALLVVIIALVGLWCFL